MIRTYVMDYAQLEAEVAALAALCGEGDDQLTPGPHFLRALPQGSVEGAWREDGPWAPVRQDDQGAWFWIFSTPTDRAVWGHMQVWSGDPMDGYTAPPASDDQGNPAMEQLMSSVGHGAEPPARSDNPGQAGYVPSWAEPFKEDE